MSFVEWFWISWGSTIVIPMILMALLMIGFVVLGLVLEVVGRIGEWFSRAKS